MKTLCSIALVIIASIIVNAQNEEPLLIPIETNNQFPPDQLDTDALIEGSGGGENKIDTTTEMHQPAPELESVDSETDINPTSSSDSATELPCPNPCVCSTEGDTDNYVVDCSGYDLTEFPSPIDSRTTTLKLHNNKLTVIPKEISDLKNLKILNAENNSIMELASGSVSELPELVILKLANNRLIEYPMDLKNSISLTKLEELDLGGNDIRTVVTAENFSNFKNLRVLTLPSATSELVLDLCGSLKDTLESVCTESCNTKTFECPDAPERIDEELLDATLPGTISLSNRNIEESGDPMEETPIKSDKSEEVTSTEEPPFSTDATSIASEGILEERSEPQEEQKGNENDLLGATLPGIIALSNAILKDSKDFEAPTESKSEDNVISTEEPSMPIIPVLSVSVPKKIDEVIVSPRDSIVENSKKLEDPAVSIETSSVANGNDVNDFSLREKVINEPKEVSPLNNIAQEPKDNHEDVKIGANTVDTKTGGVDKSIIGIIVAGMIVVVAGITIKKNWSSITKRFSSNPRPHERNGVHSNGTAPEEVPLQDKSPV